MSAASRLVTLNYKPRPYQEFLHARSRRFNVFVCHRRFGKTVFSVNEALDRAMRCQRRNPQIAYMAPTFGAAKRIAWEYVKDAVRHLPGIKIHEGELKVTIPRVEHGDEIRFYLLGAENPGALRGIYLDGIIIDEYSEIDPVVWKQVVRPALSDREGWAIFIFTPKGSNHAHELFMHACRLMRADDSEWYAVLFKASETKIIPEKELRAAREIMSPEEYEQEYECSFTAALTGAYYKREMAMAHEQGRICRVPYDPYTPVITAWDLGLDDSTAIWFLQEKPFRINAIDYFECNGKGFDFIVNQVLNQKGYGYGRHILPHDVAQREISTGKTRLSILTDKLKLKNVTVAPRLKREDGIQAVRTILPRTWFESELCGYGIEALKSYERVFDSKENVFKTVPKHNWASHGADAMRTFATGYRLEDERSDHRDLERSAESDYDVMGF